MMNIYNNQLSEADQLRLRGDYFEAEKKYNNILTEYPQAVEAYWGLILNKYKVLYKEDDPSGKGMVPICGALSFDSILDDVNFEYVLKYSDNSIRKEYWEEGKKIETARKNKIEEARSDKIEIELFEGETPYDVFVRYKKNNENPELLTSTLVKDIFNALSGKGLRVGLGGIDTQFLWNKGITSLNKKEWEEARESFKRILDVDSKFSEAYLGLLAADTLCQSMSELRKKFVDQDLTGNRLFIRAERYAGDELKKELTAWQKDHYLRRERERLEAEEKIRKAAEAKENKRKWLIQEREKLEEKLSAKSDLTVLGGEEKSEIERKIQIFTVKQNELESDGKIYFGKYPQDNNVEPIEWKVLLKEDDRLLLISNNILDCRKFNERDERTSWEKCDLRKWLNEGFLNAAFTKQEQLILEKVVVKAEKNPKYDTSAGNDTEDRIFILSIPEVERYFADDEERKCIPTSYAILNGAYTSNKTSCGWWWTRSPGYDNNGFGYISDDGSVTYDGHYVLNFKTCVRPAVWINLHI